MAETNKEITFGLVHGAFCGAWVWENVIANLEVDGYRAIAMDLPVDNPNATFDDYANIVVDTLENAGDVVLVGWSRGCDVVPRAAGRLAAQKLIYVCPTFKKATIGVITGDEYDRLPPRNSNDFKNAIIPMDDGRALIDTEAVVKLFFEEHQTPEINEAIRKLRAQRRIEDEPTLLEWPDVDQAAIICPEDKVVNIEWARPICREFLKIDPVELEGGHAPLILRPKRLTDSLISLALG
jgi:pimeloyl-ACP methyl ester carboxylesterase